MLTLYPYKIKGNKEAFVMNQDRSVTQQKHSTWVFDDPSTGLVAEAFVCGTDLAIDYLTQNIANAIYGFALTFSASEFPNMEMIGTHFESDGHDGNWYRWNNSAGVHIIDGWLCPALLLYFSKPPKNLYVRADSLSDSL